VLVNEEPITSHDVKLRAKMMSLFSRGKQGEQQAIDQLIEERLMLQEAKRRNVNVTDEEVEAEFANRARAAQLTAEQFTMAFRQAGIDLGTFKDFLRANMAWQEVVRARFRATVEISDQDVAQALSKRGDVPEEAQETAVEYRLQQIIFVVPKGAEAGVEAQRTKQANEFRAAFAGCDQSLQQAAGMAGVVVKPQIRREAAQLAATLKESLAKLEVGGVTEPQKVPEGIQIVALCAKNEIAGQTQAAVEARADITNERGALLARRYLRDLRSDAVIEYR
jgi:peptidyl-prolyl cis-trans isomerase SurA